MMKEFRFLFLEFRTDVVNLVKCKTFKPSNTNRSSSDEVFLIIDKDTPTISPQAKLRSEKAIIFYNNQSN